MVWIGALMAPQPGGLPETLAPPRPPSLTTTISLAVRTRAGEKAVSTRPGKDVQGPQPVAVMGVGETPQIRYTVRNTDLRHPVRGLVLRLRVAKGEEAGAQTPPGREKGAILETEMSAGLAAGGANRGRYNTPIHEPGNYRVEVALVDPEGNRRQYCALALQVLPAKGRAPR